MIKAILFDVDDTLIDFSRLATPIHIKVAKRLKIKIPDKYKLNRLYGMPWENIAKIFWPDENYKKLRQGIIKELKKQKFKPFPGAINTLKKLKNNYILGIVSSKPKAILISQFKQAKIHYNYFKLLYAAED